MSKFKTQFAAFVVAALVILAGCAGDRDGDADMADTTDTMAMDMDMDMDMAGDSLRATLSGAAEVPGPGDSDGSGTAAIGFGQADSLCYTIQVQGIGEPTAAHIHSGGPQASGPPVVDLAIATNGLSGCVQADAATVDRIQATPDSFYVNVHTAEFGAGAVRGQLGSGMGM